MNKRPIDITILAALAIIGGIGGITFSLLMIPQIITPSWWGVISLIYAFFLFVIAYGFLKAKNWARIAFLLLMVIAAINYLVQAIMDRPMSAIFPIISILIVTYALMKNPKIRAYFGKK